MKVFYECCICHKPIQRNKRIVYQEFENIGVHGFFRSKVNYDLCNDCFKIFNRWITKHQDKRIKLEVEDDDYVK